MNVNIEAKVENIDQIKDAVSQLQQQIDTLKESALELSQILSSLEIHFKRNG